MSTGRRGTRRRPAEVRALLVEAATKEFSINGLHGATTGAIAARAGVALSVMYRHFDSKEDLFQEAMLAPLVAFFDEFAETWKDQREEPWDAYRLLRSFVASLYEALVSHRASLAMLAGASHETDPDVVRQVQVAVARLFEEILVIGVEESKRRRWFSADGLDLAIRLIVGLVLGVVAFQPVVLAGTHEADDVEDLLNALTALSLWGLRRAPGDVSP